MDEKLEQSSGKASFSMVMTELHQKFTVEKTGVYEESSRSWTDYDSANRTANALTSATSSSAPEFQNFTTRKPIYGLTPTMGPICAATIQLALIRLRPVPHPVDFPSETIKSILLSPTLSPIFSPETSMNSVASDFSEVHNQNVLKSIQNSRELTRSVSAYLKSANSSVESQPEQEYKLTYERHDVFQPAPEKNDDINCIHQNEETALIPADRSIPRLQEIESFGSGDQIKDHNQPRSFLEQILEAKNNLKPFESIDEEGKSDTVRHQVVAMKSEKRKKKEGGFFSRLKFWKKRHTQSKMTSK